MKALDVLLFGGQSNMQGQTEQLLDGAVVPGAWEYRLLTDEAVPLCDPVGENIRSDGTKGEAIVWGMTGEQCAQWLASHTLGAACYGHTTLVPAFCRAYREQTGQEVLAAHVARGSTHLALWLPGTDGYRLLVKKAAGALRKAAELGTVGRVFFVWLQGESDAVLGHSRQQYKEELTRLAQALTADVGIHRFGVIRVGRFAGDARDDEILAAQEEICREREEFLLLTDIATRLNEQPEYMNPFAGGHYSASGLVRLGEAAGEAMGRNR